MASPRFQLSSTETALAFTIPKHLQTEINSMRKIHDKAYTKWQPHYNILYPFVHPALLASAVAIVRGTLQSDPGIQPIELNTDEVGTFRHRRNATVFLKPGKKPEEQLCELRRVLVKALGCADGEGTRDGTFRPHLSIGQAGLQGSSLERLVEQAARLAVVSWKATALVVLRRQESGEMMVVDELRIGSEDEDEPEPISVSPSKSSTGWKSCFPISSDESLVTANGPSACADSIDTQILTYNIMADLSAESFISRFPMIQQTIKSALSESNLRVINLQEVNEESLPLILGDPLIQATFPYSTHSPSTLLPSHRNLVTLASHPFDSYALDFPERHKSALIISFQQFNVDLANVHLTSALTDQAVQSKLDQMKILSDFLAIRQKDLGRVSVVAGDFNLTSSSRTIESALGKGIIQEITASKLGAVIDSARWVDVFDISSSASAAEYDGEEGATFDRLSNPLAALTDSPIENRPERYDRVLFTREAGIKLQGNRIFGLPNRFGRCGSDHYALSILLQIPNSEGSPRETNHSPGRSSGRDSLDIEVIGDITDIQSLLLPYLPSEADREQRSSAVALLGDTLRSNPRTGNLILAPLGSYSMDTYFSDSDVDILAIGSIQPSMFFDLATSLLQSLNNRNDDGFKGVHFVNSLVCIIEVWVRGIKFDLQYCEVPELVNRYHSTPQPDLLSLVFDKALILSLSASSIRPLNTYRDTMYLINTISDMTTYRTAYRYLSLYLRRRGLYSAKFGYLGGIHLSLMLNRVVKLVDSSSTRQVEVVSAATLVRTFLTYYSSFDWAKENVTDPTVSLHESILRSPRDAIFIPSIHVPTARKNVAASCTILTARLLHQEFGVAAEKLQARDWEWCLQSTESSVDDFVERFGAFISIEVDVWDVDEFGGDKVRDMVGGLESKLTRLLVSLGRIDGLEGQVWPERFCTKKETNKDPEIPPKEYKGYYLVGVKSRGEGLDAQQKRLFSGKILTTMREFEGTVKESREFSGGNSWVSMDLLARKKLQDLELVIDRRDWGSSQRVGIVAEPSFPAEPENCDATHPQLSNVASKKSQQKSSKSPLRPAQDIISRIHWDASLSVANFLIGYEDRFVGVKEIEMGKWKSEQTDEEFIPMHRIVWVRKMDNVGGEKVWDRREKLDLIFGSGVSVGRSIVI